MLVRPFSDLHVELWPAKSISRILRIVVPPLPYDKETVALIAGDLGLAHRHETWLTVLSILAHRFSRIVYVEGNHFFHNNDAFVKASYLPK